MKEPARTVRLSYPASLSDWGRSIVEGVPFRSYLRRVHRDVTPGETWDEFVGVGCCGDALDVPLRVESVDGGPEIDEETAFVFETRSGCPRTGGWAVQSASGGKGTDER